MFATRFARYFATAVRCEDLISKGNNKYLRTAKSTFVAGLPLHPNPLPALEAKYTHTLKVLQVLPASSVFRQSSEAVTQHRLDIVRTELSEQTQQDANANENAISIVTGKIDSGLVEELLEQAHDELGLAAKMIDWKPYEPLEVPAPPNQWKPFSMQEAAGEGNH
ncbi:hypothetical protein MVES_003264 [Malassezia vespertilionis]|uniref:Uncharacterized protein n=1 Tax=Malassezia vespertilionis TaxID=2020962 RepID=A0A2N1J8F9_9BASI|nr:hypothetical protein MVES_003264 [Malassezia vespertilionis]